MPEVSIILPTCDRPFLVPRALASLLRQSFADCEILLVDSNRVSGPVSANPALAPLLADPRVRVVSGTGTQGPAGSRNRALTAARGNWITFLDDDDEYQPDKVAAQHALARQSGAALVLCGYEFVWPTRRRRRQVGQAVFRGDEILTRAFLGTPVLFHRRTPAVRFDETLHAGEDLPYALRLVRHHALTEVFSVPRALVVVHPQPAGQSVHSDKEAAWRAYLAAARQARQFSPGARRAFLVLGALERSTTGRGSFPRFLGNLAAVLRHRGLREWRLVLYSLGRRLRGRLTRVDG